MQNLRSVRLAGLETVQEILITDEKEALLAAKAAGRAVIAVRLTDTGNHGEKQKQESLWEADYVVEGIASPDEIDDEFLERVIRRHLHLPWTILQTDRLLIREMSPADIPELYKMYSAKDQPLAAAPLNPNQEIEKAKLQAYQKHMYGFFGYGLWGLYLKANGEEIIIGRAGFENYDFGGVWLPELAYQMKPEWRQQGFAGEALTAILQYGFGELAFSQVCARVHEKNIPSQRLLARLGFQPWQEYLERGERMLIQIKSGETKFHGQDSRCY